MGKAATRRPGLIPLAKTLGVALLVIFAAGIYFAGRNELPAPSSNPPVIFKRGSALGQRLVGRSWSADYERIVTNTDQTILDLYGVKHGVIFKNNKPYLLVKADHMTVNSLTHDFSVNGPIHIEQVAFGPHRTFESDAANWSDLAQVLSFPHRSTIRTGTDLPLTVGSLTYNARTGDSEFHHVAGAVRFK
jgi:hypothetical protein